MKKRTFTLYRLGISPDESSGEGEDWSKYFRSLREAKRRRTALIEQDPFGDGSRWQDFEIERLTIERLPYMKLAIHLLNGKYVLAREQVVPPYTFKRRSEPTALEQES